MRKHKKVQGVPGKNVRKPRVGVSKREKERDDADEQGGDVRQDRGAEEKDKRVVEVKEKVLSTLKWIKDKPSFLNKKLLCIIRIENGNTFFAFREWFYGMWVTDNHEEEILCWAYLGSPYEVAQQEGFPIKTNH